MHVERKAQRYVADPEQEKRKRPAWFKLARRKRQQDEDQQKKAGHRNYVWQLGKAMLGPKFPAAPDGY